MSIIKILKPDFIFVDSRGTFVQLTKTGYSQINYINSFAGSLRGEHYHKLNSEAFYIINGKLLLNVVFDNLKESYEFISNNFFMIPPYVKHSLKFIDNTEMISMYTFGVELNDNQKDIYTD